MNKAKKRLIEVEAVERIYTYTLMEAQGYENSEESAKAKLEEVSEDNYDFTYWTNVATDCHLRAEALHKIAEHLLKLM